VPTRVGVGAATVPVLVELLLPQAVNSPARTAPDTKPAIAFETRLMHPPKNQMSTTATVFYRIASPAIAASYTPYENLL
jgi:hypothetical protein